MSNIQEPPIVSVIIPAFNADRYIADALESVQTQSLHNIEIIVVDDGSTDNTHSVVESIALSDPRIRLLTRSRSGKPSVARNAGILDSRGEYIAFMDADDIMLQGKLEAQAEVLSRIDEVVLVYHDWDYISSGGDLLCSGELKQRGYLDEVGCHLVPCEGDIYITADDFYNYMSTHRHGILTIAVMLRRDALLDEGGLFPEDMHIGEDLDLWNRLLMKYRAAFIDRVYCQYRKHTDSMTGDNERFVLGLIEVQKRNMARGRARLSDNEIHDIRRQIAERYLGLGYDLYRNDDRKRARAYYKRALCLYPRFRNLLSFLKTFLPFRYVRGEQR